MSNQGRIGVYVDAVNVTMNGGYGLRYDILRKFATRCGGCASRMNVYVSYDEERMNEDLEYERRTNRFSEMLRDFEFKVTEKPISIFEREETGDFIANSSIEMDMTVDMLVHADHLAKVVLITGSGSFTTVVNALQNKGCKVELVGFNNVSYELKKAVDSYVSGYTIPGLLPVDSPYQWGESGSRVRGVCYDYSSTDGYGFMRFLTKLEDKLWITDSRDSESPFKTVFAHISQFEGDFDPVLLPSRDLIFEFDLIQNDKGLVAERIELVSK